MVDVDTNTNELDAVRQGFETNLRQLQTLLDSQSRLRGIAEETAAETRGELERLAEALCPGVVDELRKGDPAGVAQVGARALADGIIRDVHRRLSRLGAAEAAGQSVGEMYDETTAENARLRAEVSRMEQELTELRRRDEQGALHTAVLQQTLEDAQRRLSDPGQPETTAPPPAPVGAMPEWVQEWQRQQSHERDLALLGVLAETGVARRAEAAKLFGNRTGLQPGGGGVSRMFQRCARLGLIELVEAKSDVGGAGVHHLLRLTERGRDACRLLLSRDPVPSRTTELLKRHKSAAHALLNLEAGDLLRDAGYEVDLFPGQVTLPEGRVFAPDLSASLRGRTLFVEVERETRKDARQRDRKWQNYYDATGGKFCIVVADKKALDAIKSEIMFWAGQRKLVLWMTAIGEVKGKGKQEERVWTFKRGGSR